MHLRILALVLWVAVLFAIAYFGAHIDPERTYGFGRALAHGFLAVQNWIISWFDGRDYWAPRNSGGGYTWGWYLGLLGMPMLMGVIARLLTQALQEWAMARRYRD